ncbi:MAG: NAD(P)/FAD-dependent oxidoreductase [Myxococcota bacterium]
MVERAQYVVVGAGLVGTLLSLQLARQGKSVKLFEKRADPRQASQDAGRSINLVLTSRGLAALDTVGLRGQALRLTVPVYGRILHNLQGEQRYQPYSRDDSRCNYAISRATLNTFLLDQAEQAGVEIAFSQPLTDYNLEHNTLNFEQRQLQAERIFATDGAGSLLRQRLVSMGRVHDRVEFLSHGYKELTIPAGKQGEARLDPRGLHIWPRGQHMLMALPNRDQSMTVTLYLAHEGPVSFAALQDAQTIEHYFSTHFPDARPLMHDLINEFLNNPVGLLGTVYTEPWHVDEQILLLGDASHAIVPFFGQGMNAGFEDCQVLMHMIEEVSPERLFSAFSNARKPDADAIAHMALENFEEMSAHVADSSFLLQKRIEAKLGNTFPALYLSRYAMVTQTQIPYAVAKEIGAVQQQLLQQLSMDVQHEDQLDLDATKTLLQQKLGPLWEHHQIQPQSLLS